MTKAEANKLEIEGAIDNAITLLCDIAEARGGSVDPAKLDNFLDRRLSQTVGALVTARRLWDEQIVDRTRILIEERNVYGNPTFYPACKESEFLAQLAGTKTLTEEKLRLIQRHGVEVAPKQAQSLSFSK